VVKKKLLIALTTAGVATAALGGGVLPASAEQRTFQITLATGQVMTVTVDVPPGTPVDAITFPGVNGVVVQVVEITPPAQTQPAPQAAPAPAAPAPAQTTPSDGSGSQSDAPARESTREAEPQSGTGGRRQRTTGGERDPRNRETQAAAGSGYVPDGAESVEERDRRERENPRSRYRDAGGAPTTANPTFTLAEPGPAPVGVPNFFIDRFRIPPFLLSIYQAAGTQYGVRWEVLAAINEIETDYGRNLNVSSAGALGWMQFMPATWRAYGVDANGDNRKDPYNPVDAIFSAARYLRAAGADRDLRRAIFAYNHADWYVDSVLMRARLIGGMPADLVGSLTGLTQGRFPVAAHARYADDISERDAERRIARGRNAAVPVESSSTRRGIRIFADAGSPVIAVQDGRIVRIGRSRRLGRFVMLRDAYGNTYTYAHLGSVADRHLVPRRETPTREQVARELRLPRDPRPTQPASGTTRRRAASARREAARPAPAPTRRQRAEGSDKERLYANPTRPGAYRARGRDQVERLGGERVTTFRPYFVGELRLDADEAVLRRLRVGSRVSAGTILGRIGEGRPGRSSHTLFEIRPAGRGAPRIDPKPILDGWKLLESTAVYRAEGRNPFFGPDAEAPTIGQILLMSKEQLQRRVLSNPRVDVYACGRRDIASGIIDRRVLATLEFLSGAGLRPTVTSLRCGHSYLTASGNVSHHSYGSAVDIAKINGIPILGHQGEGSVTDLTIRRLLTLQGTMRPAQIISLMTYDNADNTFAMSDHADHIHVGFQPELGSGGRADRRRDAVLRPSQWIKLIDRLGRIDNPTVRLTPSRYAITVRPRRGSRAHSGD